MEVTIRPMRQEEAAPVQKLGRRSFEALESLWVTRPKQALVAVAGERIVGAIIYSLMRSGSKKLGYIDFAFVDPAFHGQGIGGRLYRAATEHLWSLDCDAITALVKDDNVGSWGLFLKNGFARVSLPEFARRLGWGELLRQFFATPLGVAVGMEVYLAVRDGRAEEKRGTAGQLLAYGLANLFLLLFVLLRVPADPAAFSLAYLTQLGGGVLAGYAGAVCSRRNWRFRLNSGGGLICALVNTFGGVFPMVGNWYPERYDDTPAFRRDMARGALLAWILTLLLTATPLLFGRDIAYLRYLGQIGLPFLVYRVLAFYPFESFGGRRVLRWNRWAYGVLAALSAAVVVMGF